MGRSNARPAGAKRRATDDLLLARLLGVAEPLPATVDARADEQLLRELLLPPDAPSAHGLPLRTILLGVATILVLLTCVPLAFAATSVLAIRNNVAAMRLTDVEAQRSNVEAQRFAIVRSRPQAPVSSPLATPSTPPVVAGSTAADVVAPTAQTQSASAAADLEAIDFRPSTLDLRPKAAPVAKRRPTTQAAITVLLLGVDRRPGQSGPARADSVIVARLEPQSGRVALVSFPRDLQVEIPGIGWDRINATTVYGDMYPELGGGLALARRTVETMLGIPIDHAVSVDFGGFIGAVDALGGITVDVEREVYDSYTENRFAAGAQHMDGRTALWYSRIRFLDSDFERMRRQQSVLLGLLGRIREQNTLQRLHSIATVTGALRGYIQTDLSDDQLVRLAWGFRNLAPEAVEQYRLEVDQVDIFVNPADPYAQHLRPGAVESLVRKLLGDTP